MGKPWVMYVVQCRDQSLYTGISTCVERRVHEHNFTKKGARYTKTRRPVTLLHYWKFNEHKSAARAELRFKKLSRARKLKAISDKTLPFPIENLED